MKDAWDPESFRALGHAVIDRLADHLDRSRRGLDPVVDWKGPAATQAEFVLDPAGGEDPLALLDRVLARSVRQAHPHYVGYQVSAPLPVAALFDLVASSLNNGMAAYESGPASTAAEIAVTQRLAALVGWAEGRGVLTSGGTLGNLTALLQAKHALGGGAPAVWLTGDQTHYCIARAVRTMGGGAVISVPTDEHFRMRPEALERAITGANAKAVYVVATAGTTSTGSFDPIADIADVCARHGAWLHVDGAHGAASSLSPKYRALVSGIEKADSLVWDLHKMLSLPALVTAVLVRDPKRSEGALAQHASYLFESEERDWDIGLRTYECTKRMMSLGAYAALSVLGEQFFDDYVTRQFDLAARFADRIESESDFSLAVRPQCNIVCFRHGDRDQDAIRTRLRNEGRFFLTRTVLRGVVHLRVTLMSPHTTDDDLKDLLEAIRRC